VNPICDQPANTASFPSEAAWEQTTVTTMKQNQTMKRNLLMYAWAGLLLCSGGLMTAQAASSIVDFSVDMATNIANGTFNPAPPAGTGADVISVFGSFNGYANPGLILVQAGSSTIYTNSYNDTSDANGTTVAYRFLLDGNAEPLSCYDNRADYLPATSGATVVLPTAFYGGDGPVIAINVKFQVDMSEEIELGNFQPQNGGTVVIAGSFNGWSPTAGSQYVLTNDPSIMVTNNNFIPPLVLSNVYTAMVPVTTCANGGTGSGGLAVTNEIQEWQYVELPGYSWGGAGAANNDQSGNRFFIDNTNQVLPLVTFNDAPYAPLANVTLKVDMTGIIQSDPDYVPNSVTVWGTFNSWSTGLNMTNNPSAPNPNIFSVTTTMPEGVANVIQTRYTNSVVGGWVYDYIDDNVYNNNARRLVTLPITSTTLNTNFPTYYFLDLAPDDYLPTATPVLFSVDMNGAVGTDGHVFTPGADGLYINGMFADGGGYPQAWYAWAGLNPVSAPSGYQMTEEGTSTIYTNTILIPAGTTVGLQYQYGMDPDEFNGGPLEDEAPSGDNHIRVVRTTGLNPYVMPTDVFTNAPYQEPVFAPGNLYEGIGTLGGGNLSVGAAVAGKVPVTWLGRPGAHLQASASGVSGPWQDISVTDGATWTNGVNTANGLLSVTNWPASGNAFFRLVKP
jgi:hypothetical protein